MKISKFNDFVNESVSAPEVLKDFVTFLEKSPTIDFYAEDEDGVREGWITKEHKLYSLPGIKNYFKKKYGKDYTSLAVDNAIMYDQNMKKLKKMLTDKGMTLQSTSLKGQFGDKSWFYSVDLEDSEITSIKKKYEEEFAKRYEKYTKRKAEAKTKKVDTKKAPKKAAKKATKVSEAFELLIEGLFNIK